VPERLVLVGERSLRRAVGEFVVHYHHERNHQGRHNAILCPEALIHRRDGPIAFRPGLGGLLTYYNWPAA
jgi:putative transposase